jgi:hypothetical protein
MRIRAAVLGVTVLTLTACGTAGGPVGDPSATPGTSTEVPEELVLPEDALLGLVGILTAPNGATADLAVVVHASLPWMVPEAADAVAATVAWCAGEIDDGVISGRGYTFTQVDIRLTARDGEWPDDLALLALPVSNPEVGSAIVAGDGLRQVDADASGVFGDGVPHCLQPALLDGLGEGTLYLGIPQDIVGVNDLESFTGWTLHDFGLSAVLPGDLGATDVVFSSCSAALTPLGEEFGAPNDTWADRFADDLCAVGGSGAD